MNLSGHGHGHGHGRWPPRSSLDVIGCLSAWSEFVCVCLRYVLHLGLALHNYLPDTVAECWWNRPMRVLQRLAGLERQSCTMNHEP